MGSTSSRAAFDSDVDKAATISDCNKLWNLFVASRKSAVSGGAVGGALDNYISEGRIVAKGEIVAKVADALRAANIKVPESSDDEKLAQNILAALPDPRQGKRFPAEARKQAAICRKLAKVFNDQFSPGATGSASLIDISGTPEAICMQVYEFARSLRAAASAEFLAVYADVRLTFKKMSIMRKVMSDAYDRISKTAIEGTEGADAVKAEALDAQYRAVDQQLNRYLQQLHNYMSAVIEPAEADIVKLTQDDEQFEKELEALNLKLGSPAFSKGLQLNLLAMGNSTLMAAKLDKALKTAGMPASEFKRISSNDELDAMLDKLQDKRSKDVSLGEFLAAAELIRGHRNFEESVKGGACGYEHGDDGERDIADDLPADASVEGSAALGDLDDEDYGDDMSATGGADDDFTTKKLDKRIKRMREEKRLVLTSFNRRVRKNFDDLLEAVAALGPRLGKEIPLNARTDSLRDALLRINAGEALELKQIYFALSGYIRDPAAREKKETFLADLRMIRAVLGELMGAAGYGDARKFLAPMAEAIDGLISTVTSFSEEVEKKYRGRGESASVAGGDDDDVQLPNIARSAVDLQKAISDFQYFYYVAGIKENLSQTHKELAAYGEGYAAKLADAIGAERNRVRKEGEAAKTALAATVPGPASIDPKVTTQVDRVTECRDEFWRAVEAIDLYLKEFTEAITANPDDVKSIAGMLDDTVVIAKWFREETGDNLCRAFECMPRVDDATKPSQALAKDAAAAEKGEHDAEIKTHYYEEAEVKAGRVGDATKGNDLTNEDGLKRVAQAQRYLEKSLNNFQALKNVMSVVTTIGDKLGSGFAQRMSMSPAQIYDKLLAFLKCAAFAVDTTGGKAEARFAVAGSDFGSDATGDFTREYNAFARALKALAAKVLTVLGVFDMFEKPGRLREIGPVRLITGGAAYGPPKVIPEAAELYFRLTLLAEFYQGIFMFQEAGKDSQISMIPEVEGVFSGLIYIVFERAAAYSSESGNYTPDDLAALVREINAIYQHFSASGKDATTKAIHAFVAEINRRYGIVHRDQWAKWLELRAKMRSAGSYSGDRGDMSTDLAILRGEGSANRRGIGSDRFVGLDPGALGAAAGYKSKYSIGDETVKGSRALIVELMDKVYAKLGGPDKGDLQKSYTGHIARARDDIRMANTDEKRFDVVRNLIQGAGSFTRPTLSGLVMFHETVVVGLNALIGLHNIAAKFVKDVNDAGADPAKLIEALYSVSSCDGVTVSVRYPKSDSQAVFLDFGGLKNMASTLLGELKSMMDRFRMSLSKETIKKYEASSGGATVKTIYDLDAAFEKLLFNREVGSTKAPESIDTAAIELNKKLVEAKGNDITAVVIRMVAGQNNGMVGTDLPVFAPPPNKSRPKLADEGGAPGNLTITSPSMSKALADITIGDLSLMDAFNRAAYQYLKGNLDASGKIYAGLINSFVNGPLSAVIMSGAKGDGNDGAADLVPAPAPLTNAPLYKSLVRAYYRTYMSMADSATKQHLYLDLSDVPAHMKETYRVNLSLLISNLDAIRKRGEFLKEFIRSSGMGNTGADQEVRAIDAIMRGVYSLKGAAEQVVRELADEPVFLETYAGSIRDYQQRQNALPLMPFSALFAGTDSASVAATTAFTAPQSAGTNTFKYVYGTRGLLSGELGRPVPMPGVDAIVAAYNASASGSSQLRAEEAKKFYGRLLPIIQCLMSKNQYMRQFASSGVAAADDSVRVNNKSIQDVLDGAEATDQDRVLERLTAGITSGRSEPGQSDRAGMRSRNIADLNIMPINVHAIMREAPLANIYNYEYTFDQMLSQMLTGAADGVEALHTAAMQPYVGNDSGLKTLMNMTILPYRKVDATEYTSGGAGIPRIFRGQTGVGLGRPKFLSDQLYNKVLFGEIYGTNNTDESGPTVSGNNDSNLKYPMPDGTGKKNPSTLGNAVVDIPVKAALVEQGKKRFDTAIVRSLFFVSNMQRILRARIMRDMSEYRSILSRSHNVVNPMVTEYTVGQAQNFAGMSEQLDANIY